MPRRAVSVEERRTRKRDRARKLRLRQRQERLVQYELECMQYSSTVRLIAQTVDPPPAVPAAMASAPG
ncbi:patatin-like phospholipase [Metarhizium robertsii ARSEF 23]|uniref:Patatin-like phospholipase n=1 Tax=Metarhizium robertsii (strain ARSEF 23 / ATCC MYA-3075) TaxID=655844 RepID=A0A0B2XD96_METRA|nr:patatin-like phospholipase [Metarhizium robertsii ARSEF 23]KHO10685.1 patatin-like phospholipase [Metarhizium robertsii ARSEF 23]